MSEGRDHLGDDALFPAADNIDAYREALADAGEAVVESFLKEAQPYSGATPEEIAGKLADFEMLPEEGKGLDAALDRASPLLEDAVGVTDPNCVAHLQCPPLIAGLAAEVLVTATNQSLDSFDQSPAATQLEREFVHALCEWYGYDAAADGVFTSGGTQSNFTGLLLARNRVLRREYDVAVQQEGLPPDASELRILCSEAAHFTASQAASHLGLGESAVVTVPTDEQYRLSLSALDETIERLQAAGRHPFAIVGTAGTTDYGSIDPLEELAKRAAEHGCWLHVDAAWGGALAFSDVHASKLSGIEAADSIAIDFHKQVYQPISCGALLVRDGELFDLIDRSAAYLNPERDEAAGVPNLVSKSVQTTRRFDALKPFLTLQAIGREGLATLVDHTIDLAGEAADIVAHDPSLELVHESAMNVVLFRYVPETVPTEETRGTWSDAINEAVRSSLFDDGEAVIARTTVDGRICLKCTLLNPRTTRADLESLFEQISAYGNVLEPSSSTSPRLPTDDC